MNNNAFWEDISEEYNDLVGDEGDRHHKFVINPIVAELLGDLKGKVVLDAACGNGYISRKMAQTAKKVYGVDFSQKLIALAQKNSTQMNNLEFQVGNLEQLSFDDNFFDTVLCNMALMNMEHLPIVINELARVVKTNGNLVISITHPCFENQPYTKDIKDELGMTKGRLITSYFPTGLVVNTENNHLHYHYLLSEYLNFFADAGLFLEKAIEPDGSALMHSEEKDITPIFLITKLKKV